MIKEEKFIKVKEELISKDGVEFTVFDEWTSGTVKAVLDSWNDKDQVELKSPKLILDIGANVGVWSFYMAKKYPRAFIIAIEPILSNVECFRAGIEKNKLTNLSLLKCAVSELPVTLRSHKSNSGSASAFIPMAHNFRNEYISNVVTLNKLFEDLTMSVDLMKVDVEGMEYQIFNDFKYWNNLNALTIELHPWPQFKTKKEQKKRTDELICLLRKGMGDKPLKFTYPELHEDKDDFHAIVQPNLRVFDEQIARLDS